MGKVGFNSLVQGLEFRVQAEGLEIWAVQGLEFRIQGLGFRA